MVKVKFKTKINIKEIRGKTISYIAFLLIIGCIFLYGIALQPESPPEKQEEPTGLLKPNADEITDSEEKLPTDFAEKTYATISNLVFIFILIIIGKFALKVLD